MALSSIRLQNFRSYSDRKFEIGSNINVVVGSNASGKTNLLEAVLVLCRGTSYRAKDVELIKFNKTWARVDGQFQNHTRTLKLISQGQTLQKEFLLDNEVFKRLSLDRTVPLVLFEPDHLRLITSSPSRRRDYMDDLLLRSQPDYRLIYRTYNRTLAQRNILLKKRNKPAANQLFVWDVRLSELGGKIVEYRCKLIEQINQNLSQTYSRIAGQKSSTLLAYQSPLPAGNYSTKLLNVLQKNINQDILKGFTSFGPHRDDIAFYLNDKPINATASRGETRSLLLALKIYELDLIEQARGSKPIFLLDDVFSELDNDRRRFLVNYLINHQAIITTANDTAATQYFSVKPNTIKF